MLKRLRDFFKTHIIHALQWEARLVLKRYRPKIIGVTGNMGKTSTKEAIYHVLAPYVSLARSPKSFNSELGLPLAILQLENAWDKPLDWIKNLVAGLGLALLKHSYPKELVLELGVDRPGDMRSVIKWLKCDYAVLTGLPDLPVHIEFFESVEQLHAEKILIFKSLKPGGIAFLNADDPHVAPLKKQLPNAVTFGFDPKADVRANSWQLVYEEIGLPAGRQGKKMPTGITFKLEAQGGSVPVRIPGLVGRHQLYAPLAAAAVALAHNVPLLEVATRLEGYTVPVGRLKLIKGLNDSLILDDSYNASPIAMEEALHTLHELGATGGRRVALLGDMLDLGSETIRAHREVGVLATRSVDFLITIGQRAKFIYAEAEKKRFGKRKLKHCDSREEAVAFLQDFIKPGDVILVKGSQGARLEKIVEKIMLEPQSKKSLLPRQDYEWSKR